MISIFDLWLYEVDRHAAMLIWSPRAPSAGGVERQTARDALAADLAELQDSTVLYISRNRGGALEIERLHVRAGRRRVRRFRETLTEPPPRP